MKEFGPVGGGGGRRKLLYVDPPLLIIVVLVLTIVISFHVKWWNNLVSIERDNSSIFDDCGMYIYHFVVIRLNYYGTSGYCFYETSLVKHIPEYDVVKVPNGRRSQVADGHLGWA